MYDNHAYKPIITCTIDLKNSKMWIFLHFPLLSSIFYKLEQK